MCGSAPPSPAGTWERTVPAMTFEPLRIEPLPLAFSSSSSAFRATFCSLPFFLPERSGRARRRGRRPSSSTSDRQLLFLALRGDDGAGVPHQLVEARVGVAVAEAVFEDDEVAELGRVAHLADHPVVDGDDRGALLGEDVDPARGGGRGDDFGRVAGDLGVGGGAFEGGAGGDFVRVTGVGGDREVGTLGEAGQRADQGGGDATVGAGVGEDLLRVPVGVVVGEDRAVEVLLAAGDLEVVGGGADRVDRVVGVLATVPVGVQTVGFPARREELHPADGAGAGDVEVGPEAGLDFVDRREDLPGDPVFGSAGLVDRQQEGRDLEGVDDEVGDADRGRAERRDRGRRVGEGGGAAGFERGAAVAVFAERLVAAAGRVWRLDATVVLGAAARVAEAFVVGDPAMDFHFRFGFERFAVAEFLMGLLGLLRPGLLFF